MSTGDGGCRLRLLIVDCANRERFTLYALKERNDDSSRMIFDDLITWLEHPEAEYLILGVCSCGNTTRTIFTESYLEDVVTHYAEAHVLNETTAWGVMLTEEHRRQLEAALKRAAPQSTPDIFKDARNLKNPFLH